MPKDPLAPKPLETSAAQEEQTQTGEKDDERTSTPVNDPKPLLLEYNLRESVAFLTIWNNIKDPIGLGLLNYIGKMSKKLWTHMIVEFSTVANYA